MKKPPKKKLREAPVEQRFDVVLLTAWPGLAVQRIVRTPPTDRKLINGGNCLRCRECVSTADPATLGNVWRPVYALTRARGSTAKARGYAVMHRGCLPTMLETRDFQCQGCENRVDSPNEMCASCLREKMKGSEQFNNYEFDANVKGLDSIADEDGKRLTDGDPEDFGDQEP